MPSLRYTIHFENHKTIILPSMKCTICFCFHIYVVYINMHSYELTKNRVKHRYLLSESSCQGMFAFLMFPRNPWILWYANLRLFAYEFCIKINDIIEGDYSRWTKFQMTGTPYILYKLSSKILLTNQADYGSSCMIKEGTKF